MHVRKTRNYMYTTYVMLYHLYTDNVVNKEQLQSVIIIIITI